MIVSEPSDGLKVTQDTRFRPGVYLLPQGISISADGITVDGQGAVFVGANHGGSGITVTGQRNVTLKNLTLRDYYHGIRLERCETVMITGCQSTATAEVPANTLFLDIWRPASEAYGAGIFMHQVSGAVIAGNDLQHQMNGLLSYRCRQLEVRNNIANYCSGFGFHLNETCDSLFSANTADFCCRYHARSGGQGHMGADAAGFLIVNRSSRNVFRGNWARLGGDGFFLAGLTPEAERVGCNDNLFEDNDASFSPNNAFEGTFSRGNIYRRNKANGCNYGFWLGFSANCRLEENTIWQNRQAGIAVENGVSMSVRKNDIRFNNYGILLWSKYVETFAGAVPENDTSRGWTIEENYLVGNAIAIRIAANQDHGLWPLPGGTPSTPRPRNHTVRGNLIRENRLGIELEGVETSQIEHNDLQDNMKGDIVEC